MILSPRLIEQCVELLKQGTDGVVIPEVTASSGILKQLRRLEKLSYQGNDVVEAVRFTTRRAFESLRGFDESVHGPDEYEFDSRFRQADFKVSHCTETIMVIERIFNLAKKFNFGRNWKLY